jgi:Tfp pilus assembly protein PilV
MKLEGIYNRQVLLLLRKRRPDPQDGVSMIELMIAGVVMTVGFLGLMILITTAIATNNRNRLDSTGTMLAQAVMEQIKSTIVGSSSSSLSDCAGHTFTIDSAVGGATLSGSTVDFTAAPVTNYSMSYVICNGTQQTTYDVRWNVTTVGNNYLVTVGSKMKGQGTDLKYFALPVTLRAFLGN